MNLQAVLIRGALLLALCLAFSAVALQIPAKRVAQSEPVTAFKPDIAATVPVVLPTITVRPSAAEIAAAMNGEDADEETSPTLIDVTQPSGNGTTVSLHSLRLDMPYYSFGKALPRVSRK